MNTRTSRILEDTLDNPFDLTRYQAFSRELLNQFEAKPFRNSGNVIPQGYDQHVALFGRIGTYTDPDGQTVDILYVRLRERGQMIRARALQRNFVARHLKNRDKDGALVAFYVDGVDDWRLSLVWRTEVMAFDDDKEKVTFDEQLTPTRRSSYLLGATEPSHTAKQQLLPLLESRTNPTLAQLQSVFGVERITKEFFDQYKMLYLHLYDALERLLARDNVLQRDFAAHTIDTHNFAKKLLGQIVFLYFLQKKGWLGVRGADWRTGSHRFLRDLFEGQHVAYHNFFNDVLEPLFYEALAEQRPDDWYGTLNCRIPFLNGGLFEPMNGYDWRGTTLALPNTLFSNKEMTQAGDVGTGILDVFDRYNFTVHEEEPLEKEVAVDPEMLGKVFENLLEVTDRKSKGAFYTPREIVHYMCQESLINYLNTAINYQELPIVPEKPKQGMLFAETKLEQGKLTSRQYVPIVPREQLSFLIRHSGAIKADRDSMKAAGRLNDEAYQLPEAVRTHAMLLDKKLADIKVCDPAIGSGAFPVGMMAEIVRARVVLQAASQGHDPNLYNLKRHAIQHSLYGVDIDPAAVDIAQLRLWLSLVVDEENMETIDPLPNLDYRIVSGNSLIGLPHTTYGQTWRTPKIVHVEGLKERFFNETDHDKKMVLKQEIDQTIVQQLATAKIDFDFKLVFSEVWFKNDGFDVVVGNPPYVRHELIKEMKPALKPRYKEVYTGTADLYVYFYARGLQLLKPNGTLAYITSNKWLRANYGNKLRQLVGKNYQPNQIIDFGELPIFDAGTFPMIFIGQNEPTTQPFYYLQVKSLKPPYPNFPTMLSKIDGKLPVSTIQNAQWRLTDFETAQLLTKIEQKSVPLKQFVKGDVYFGLKTGFNKAFIINQTKKDELISHDPGNADLIKPLAVGNDVRRWRINYKKKYIIVTPIGVPIENYPAIFKHLSKWKTELQKRWDKGNQWWELRACAYYDKFEQPKIVYPDIAKESRFAFEAGGMYFNNTCYFISTDDLYLLGVLNSSTLWMFAKENLTVLGDADKGGRLRFFRQFVTELPIPHPTREQREKVEKIVQQLLDVRGQGKQVTALERELDNLVYKLYNLTIDEIALINKPSPPPSLSERIEKFNIRKQVEGEA